MSEEKLTPWQQYKKNLGDTRPWDLINPKTEWALPIVAENRMKICNSCPELISLSKQCKKCGCFMPSKTKLAEASCPLGKW
jgi:hypothetical protein